VPPMSAHRCQLLPSVVGLITVLSLSISYAQPFSSPVNMPLIEVADVPLPGPAVRFDYQDFDASSGRLYISHMDADQVVIVNVTNRKVVANLDGFKRVHGVLVVPKQHRLYVSVTGEHRIAVVDTQSFKTIATAGPVTYPDGLAYAPQQNRVFVSDEHGGSADAVIDATTNQLITSIPLGGEAGNTIFDPVSGHILVGVHQTNMLVSIDPATNKIIERCPLPGIQNPHGIALDRADHLAFVGGEANHSLALVDLTSMKLLSTYEVGDEPDVLAFDPGLKRLYVASEAGKVSVFESLGKKLTLLGYFQMPHAHSVAVDPQTHLVYFPLENIGGHPLLRIMRPN